MFRRKTLVLLLAVLAIAACAQKQQQQNPFFAEYDTPYGVPPFSKIREEHFMPAFSEGIARHEKEIAAIASDPAEPTFENTVLAVEYSGDLLGRVSEVFFSLNSSMTTEGMQEIAKESAPLLSAHRDDIILNEDLFKRFKAVYDRRADLGLTREQERLLEEHYRRFVRNGAALGGEDKAKLREINKELSVLSLQFAENLLKETNRFEMVLGSEEDLAGLPEWVRGAAAEAAAAKGYVGKWLFTLQKPSLVPFLQYSQRRDLREKIYTAYFMRGDHGDELDNKDIARRIIALRDDRAELLGYETYAHFVLEENMAKEPSAVFAFLDRLWPPALEKAKAEAAELQGMIEREGGGFELASWDWWYYAEKLKKEKYDLDDEVLKPYFPLDNVLSGAFQVVSNLWGITFEERTDIPVYHAEVRSFEVKDADGSHIGIFFVDYFPRESKRGGAWMGTFRDQHRTREGEMVTPLVYNVGNFSRPTGDMPSLLNFDEVTTLFHELGHGLHGLLSSGSYRTLTGTNVATDFVELPSQIMENWATHPEVLRMYARHYKTGETIPEDLIEKIHNARLFNQGFATVEYLAASLLDMNWHTVDPAAVADVRAFESAALDRIGLIPQIVSRYRTPYFAHIFSSGYAAGYYSYIWAEVLDADAFEAFKETSLFDRDTAARFRKCILARGGSEEPMTLYREFRGREPEIRPLLEKRGLI
ncbi:MAG: M3 family metallopeptidase [Candidatus Krumholzibacteria bacterium]|nr:M3 family metallopeptidase [Candidatus Krumholzibacteria bacterium]